MQKNKFDVIIIGAGPIGLMLANLLGKTDLNCIIFEKKIKREEHSKAIGISPPSLELLNKIGLIGQFIKNGVKVDNVIIHGTNKKLGSINFKNIPSKFPFILSIPQTKTEAILENNLKKFKNIIIKRNMELTDIIIKDDITKVFIKDNTGKNKEFSAKFICACDGNKSDIRTILKIPFKGDRYKDTFLMADFIDKTGFKNQAHLFFTKYGPVESFPLPEKKRRWIINTDKYLKEHEKQFLENTVFKRTKIDLTKSKKISENPFGVSYFINESYFYKNVLFCGDSAHVMSPIGGQGMNTGFADAEFASEILKKIILNNNNYNNKNKYFNYYKKFRKKAALIATKRAWMSMRIGTIKGNTASGIRNFLIKNFIKLFKNKIPIFYSMLNIPFSSFDKVKIN